MPVEKTNETSRTQQDIIFVLAISLIVIGLYIVNLDIGGFWWTDESRHAMDGVYLLDVLKDLPLTNLYQYTEQYFVRYPALGLTWYLPFFALVESLVFALIGISEFSARLTVLLFLLVGMAVWYPWLRNYWGSNIAFFSVALYLTDPTVLLWSRLVMLEAPAVAMMCITIVCFDTYLKKPGHKTSLIAGLSIAAMILTKQTTVLILPVLAIYSLLSGNRKCLFQKESLWGYMLMLLGLAILIVHAKTFGKVGLSNVESRGELLTTGFSDLWLFNGKVILATYSWLLLAMAAAGVIAIFIAPRSRDKIILLWFVAWYIFITFLAGSESNVTRYTVYLMPVLAFLASRPLLLLRDHQFLSIVWIILLASVAIWNVYLAERKGQPYVSGYELAANYVYELADRGTILFCCKHDGNFIFHLRKADIEKKKILLRADKTLLSMVVHDELGVKSYVQNQQDIVDMLDKLGVGVLVVEDRDRVGIPEFKLLLDLVKGPDFKLLREFSADTNARAFDGLSIRVFKYMDSKPIENGTIKIPMPHLGREIQLKV